MIVGSCLGGYRNCFLASSPMRPIGIELRPILGRAIWLVGFLSKPKMKAPGSASPPVALSVFAAQAYSPIPAARQVAARG
jgi:hypothetical protein